jgi:transposase
MNKVGDQHPKDIISIITEAVMSKQVMYVGVDVGATELWAAVADSKPRKFSHTTTGIRAMHRWAVRQGAGSVVHLCMEATGVYSQSVAIRLVTLSGSEVSIVNPACIKAFANVQLRRSKTDMIDAEVIRCYAESQCPSPWHPERKAIRQLYQLVVQADAIKASLLQWQNRDHSHSYIPDLPKDVIKSQRGIIRNLEKQLQDIEKAIDQLCAADPTLAQQVMLLETIPGIARKSAVQILAYGRHWLTDRTQKELVAHAGLAPHHHQSGTSVRGRSRIDKRGDRRLRKALYMPALVGIVHNPILKPFYQKLLENQKPKKVALVACMKKLLLISRSMLIHKTTFDPKYKHLT